MAEPESRRDFARKLLGALTVGGVAGAVGEKTAAASAVSDPTTRAAIESSAAAAALVVCDIIVNEARSWIEQVRSVAAELATATPPIDFTALEASRDFRDLVFRTTRIALSGFDEEKRQMLLHAIANAAIGGVPEKDRRAILLRLVEQLTPTHVRLLDFVLAPPSWFKHRAITMPNAAWTLREWISTAMPNAFPGAMLVHVWNELNSYGLIEHEFDDAMNRQGARPIQPQGMALELLNFIRSPCTGAIG